MPKDCFFFIFIFTKLYWQLVSQQLMLSMTDVNVILYICLDVFGRCYLPRMWWLQCLCDRCNSHLYCSGWWKPHYLEIVISCIVTDGKSHISGWCYCHNGRCYCHIIVGWYFDHVKDGNHSTSKFSGVLNTMAKVWKL